MTAERAGFSTGRTPEILLPARESRRGDFTLEVAPRTEVAVVTAVVPVVETESGAIADSKSFEEVSRLPTNTLFSPCPECSRIPSRRVSIGGGLPLQIEYSVDGISTVHVGSVSAPTDFSDEAFLKVAGFRAIHACNGSPVFGKRA